MAENKIVSDTPQNDTFKSSEIITLSQTPTNINKIRVKTTAEISDYEEETPWYKDGSLYLLAGLMLAPSGLIAVPLMLR